MTMIARALNLTVAALAAATLFGCEKSEPSPTDAPQALPGVTPAPPMNRTSVPAPQATPPGAPTAAPTADAPSSGATLDGSTLILEGLAFTVPTDWVAEPAPVSPMGPKAVFAIPHAAGSTENASVRITHYPGMKGKDEANIDRWVGQSRKADGSPMTRDEVKIEHKNLDAVKLTTVDITGAIQATMRAAPKPGSRMIAAIVDHPKGPHFVTIVGDETTIAEAEKTIRTFLDSAKVQ